MIDSLLAPGRLWLIVPVMIVAGSYVAAQFVKKKYAVRFSNTALLDKIAPNRPGWRRHVIASAFIVTLLTMVLSVAQPAAEVQVPRERATVILALDTSLSMEATDVAPTRIDAAKAAAASFIESIPEEMQLGLVAFDGNARVVVPPTTDRDLVGTAIGNLELDEGTAIGDAVDVSLEAIKNTPIDDSGEPVPGVIVLLSDGKTTVGQATESAIPAALEADVPVWTIAYGTPNGTVEIQPPGFDTPQVIDVPVDGRSLETLANQTNGESFEASSENDLSRVYEQMGTSIGYATELQDVTWKVSLVALLMMFAVSAMSIGWFQRIP